MHHVSSGNPMSKANHVSLPTSEPPPFTQPTYQEPNAMSFHSRSAFDPKLEVLQHSPVQQQHGSPSVVTPGDDGSQRKRKRSSFSTPTNGAEADGSLQGSPGTGSRPRHQPGVKRACNDCRQQKLRCNVDAGPPYQPCSRCIKHGLACSIDNDFKRLGKRAAHEEMVKELDDCKARLAQYEAMGVQLPHDSKIQPGLQGTYSQAPVAQMAGGPPFLGPSEAAASRSLLDLSQGLREAAATNYPSITPGTTAKTLGPVTLTDEEVSELFNIFFNAYHQFLPIFHPEIVYSEYFKHHPLLHWTMLAVASRRYEAKPGLLMELQRPLDEMLWTTLSAVPQTYHVVKALAILCTWPLPNSSTSQEATMMLSGIMFQLAMQFGLHRPSHAQDFSRFRIELREEEVTDRLHTWAMVNVVAQNVATGQGQPPLSRWAWYTYGLHLDQMKGEIHTRCQIEKFCDMVTRTLFTMQRDHIVEVDQAQRGLQIAMYARELNELETTILSRRSTKSPVENLYLKAAALHLHLAAFFDSPTQPNYLADLRNVYIAASALLTAVIDLPPEVLLHLPRYIEQMMLAGATTLLKLLNSFYRSHVDVPSGRSLFSRTLQGLRQLSVRSNDLPQRLAEVMAQLWQTSAGSSPETPAPSTLAHHQPISHPHIPSLTFAPPAPPSEPDPASHQGPSQPASESLQLRVRCRSSLSVLYDAIWRWRQQAGQAGRESLERAAEHPTAVSGSGSSARNTPQPAVPPNGVGGAAAGNAGGLGALGGVLGDGSGSAAGLEESMWDANFGGNAVFDPLSWALDGNLQLQLPTLGGMEGLGFQL